VKYAVAIGDKTFEVDVRGDEIRIDDRISDARLVSIPATPLRHLVMGSRCRTFALVRDGDSWVVQWGGERVTAKVLDERSRRLLEIVASGASGSSGAVVKAPMPGLVLRLDVAMGQRVEPGTGLLVLEAMKMENEITAPSSGVVHAIRVEAGQAVEKGVTLVEIAPVEA
jgi:pyruvate carboxylase subunit B